MYINQQTTSIEECRLFVAALSNLKLEKKPSLYTIVEKRGKYSVYSNSPEKSSVFKTAQIIEISEQCLAILQVNKDISQEERKGLLKSLDEGLERYEGRIEKATWFYPCNLIKRLFGTRSAVVEQISMFRGFVREYADKIVPEEKGEKPVEGIENLDGKIAEIYVSAKKIGTLYEEDQVRSLAKECAEKIADVRLTSATFSWEHCEKISQKLLKIEKKLRKNVQLQLFWVEQEKALLATRGLVLQVHDNFEKIEQEFTKKLDEAQSLGDRVSILYWIEKTVPEVVSPLRNNRFATISDIDQLSDEALKISDEINRCRKHTFDIIMLYRIRVLVKYSCQKKESESTNFALLSQRKKEDLDRAESLAQGNVTLLNMIVRIREAFVKGNPLIVFSLGEKPGKKEFEKIVKNTTVSLHPDKHLGHQEAATILVSMVREIGSWILTTIY